MKALLAVVPFHHSTSANPFQRMPQRVPGIGPQPCRAMLIGEKPGREEATHRPCPEPFVGISGKYLNLCLDAANIPRSSLFLTNCVREFTGYTKPTRAELERDKPDLIQDILECNPEIIGLVGGIAVEWVLGRDKAEMEKVHGVPIAVTELFGGEMQGQWTVLPMLHPAGAIYSPEVLPQILDDVLTLGQLLDGEIGMVIDEVGDRTDYRVIGADELDEVLLDYATPGATTLWTRIVVGKDTEGSVLKPWSLQISLRPGTGYLIHAWDVEAVEKFRQWMIWHRSTIVISLHNALYDLGVLRTIGLDLVEDGIEFVDTMIWAYLLNVEPQGLKSLAYRHAGLHQDSYDDVIGDVGRKIAMDYLQRVASATDAPLIKAPVKTVKPKRLNKCKTKTLSLTPPVPVMIRAWPEPEAEIVHEGNGVRVKKPQGVGKLVARIVADVASGKVNKDGEPVDPRKRWAKLDDRAKATVIAAIGDMRVPNLDDVGYDRATLYAERDADCQIRITPKLWSKIEAMELVEVSCIDHAVLPMLDRMQIIGIHLAATEFWDGIGHECENQMNRAQYKIFEMTGVDLNPASGDQVAELLYGKLKLQPPKYTDTGERGSVSALCLESLLSENPVVQHVMDYNEASKIRGTYVEPLRKLCMVGDRRVRSTIRSTRTTTGRLSMADPPLHQIPIMSDIGKKIRAGFIAEDGNILGDWDVDQLEMRMCAHDSRDPELCRLFNENRDVHAETACSIFSVPMSRLSVNAETGKVNDYRRSVAKHCIAEDQLVMTDQGLVPIQKITIQHKLWDGVEWVAHEGVIDQGVRGVMEYDGITATPDHEVVTETGSIQTLGQTASALVGIYTTGVGREAVRTRHRHLIETSAHERIHRAESEMYEMWARELATQRQSHQAESAGLQVMQPYQVQAPESSWCQVRRHRAALLHSALLWIRELWWARNRVPVRVTCGVREMGREAFAAPELSRNHYRPDRQQWSLRAKEFAVGYDRGAEPEQAWQRLSNLSRKTHATAYIRQSVFSQLYAENDTAWHEWRTDHTARAGALRQGREQSLAASAKVVKSARVYDILNAGPRRCFTVSGKLVLNCAFGIINGITEHGMVNYMILNRCRRPDGEPWTTDDCTILLKEWFNKYRGVKRFHLDCIAETRATGLARETVGGRVIYLPQIWSPIKKVRETAERMSYVMHTQGGGQSIIKRAMKVVWDTVCRAGWGVEPLLQMHDELLMELPDDPELCAMVDSLMVSALTETTKLCVPMKASGGFARNWLEAH